MMKKTIAMVAGVFILGFAVLFGLAASKPDTFHVERTVTIQAPPSQVFPHINNYKNWMAWSPWENVDPKMKRTYSGPEEGVGAKYAWVGNSDVGEGDMEIVSSEPEKIQIKLHFIKPFEGTSTALFTLVPEGDNTKVTWAMDGTADMTSKVIQLFISMDNCCGREFDKGLASLKTAVEKPTTASKETKGDG